MTGGRFAENRPWRRTYVWIGITAVLVVAAIAATVWTIRVNHGAASPHTDCSIVEALGPKWDKMQQSVAALETGPAETKDLLAIADAESAMANNIRSAQRSVTGNDVKAQLGDWADGTALTAKGQREGATRQAESATGADNDSMRAARLTFNATAALKKACPNLQLSPTPSR